MKKTLIIVAIIAVVVFAYGWSLYNNMVTASENVDNQWAQVETQYQRRFELIPNLVNSVQGIMDQEKEVFNNLADARTRYSGAVNADEKATAAGQVETALGRLLVIVERYPELRSVETVQNLMTQLEGTENRVSVERKRYNDTIKEYNLKVKRIPGRWIAGMFGFGERVFFDSVEGSEEAPTVELNK